MLNNLSVLQDESDSYLVVAIGPFARGEAVDFVRLSYAKGTGPTAVGVGLFQDEPNDLSDFARGAYVPVISPDSVKVGSSGVPGLYLDPGMTVTIPCRFRVDRMRWVGIVYYTGGVGVITAAVDSNARPIL